MKTIFTFLSIALATTSFSQNWTSTGALAASGSSYLIAATSIGDNVYAVGSDLTFVYSPNRGVTWTAPAITPPPGAYYALIACNNYLYASMKLNNYDHELRYSLNNGLTWTVDTVGLPQNLPNTGKEAMNVRYMGNNYVMAFNPTKAYHKKLGTSTWIATTIDYTIPDVIGMNDNWYAIGAGRMYKSTNHGGSWSELSPTGLPTGFQGNKLASNGLDRLFVSNSPANGGTDIYFSADGGNSFTLTNSAAQYTYNNAFIGAMFAVDDFIFASVLPESGNFVDEPPFISSMSASPSFSVGDGSGLPTNATISDIPFYFNSGNKLFTMYGDLFTSMPGFIGNPVIVSVDKNEALEVGIYPNPAQNQINISTKEMSNLTSIALYSSQGQLIREFKINEQSINVSDLPRGHYILKIQSTTNVGTKQVILN
ncbi:T9SS type A sorting domain-containing protein [Brumimicrobium glaciale]|uniref:T9SS type A sorting domain-containing protein n=1 Tax=Brumimicrobium glaciale TaxID=200475 RepID=A0A4Q4KHQ2_9FLAO|nr:T9SS type A sorting domain-containing protein [Brumimicrobium glaciale]RYM32803.1 T9SS type A sorting domain-containing protein [Brumimicrobium glaciale]